MRPAAALLALPLLLVCQLAAAHVRLVWPEPRSNDSAVKLGPCGTAPQSATRTRLVAGETIEVRFAETVNHPGWFRLALGDADDQGFEQRIVLDQIPHSSEGSASYSDPRPYGVSVTLPSEPCEACTLQLIQVMTDKPLAGGDHQKYFSCADVEILPPGSAGDPPPAEDDEPGGCRCTPARAPAAPAMIGLLLGLACLRRFRRAQ